MSPPLQVVQEVLAAIVCKALRIVTRGLRDTLAVDFIAQKHEDSGIPGAISRFWKSIF